MFDIRIWGHKQVKDGMSDGHVPTVIGFQEYEVPPYCRNQFIGVLPGGIARSGMVGSKELDLCYNFRFFYFDDPATQKIQSRHV